MRQLRRSSDPLERASLYTEFARHRTELFSRLAEQGQFHYNLLRDFETLLSRACLSGAKANIGNRLEGRSALILRTASRAEEAQQLRSIPVGGPVPRQGRPFPPAWGRRRA